MPRRRATSVPAAPISCGHGQQLGVARAPGLERLDRQHALRVPGDGHRRCGVQVHALSRQGAHGGDLGQQHAGHRHRGGRQVFVRRDGSSAASARTHCSGSKPMGRTTTSSLATGSSSSSDLADQRRQLGFDPGGAKPVLRGSPARRCPGHRTRRRMARRPSDGQPEHGRCAGHARRGQRITRSCSWIVTSVYLPRAASLRIGSFGPVGTGAAAPGWCSGADSASNRSRTIALTGALSGRASPVWVERRHGQHRL